MNAQKEIKIIRILVIASLAFMFFNFINTCSNNRSLDRLEQNTEKIAKRNNPLTTYEVAEINTDMMIKVLQLEHAIDERGITVEEAESILHKNLRKWKIDSVK